MRDTNLVNALREHAEWAEGNQWETPITLGDDLAEAADRIEAQTKLQRLPIIPIMALGLDVRRWSDGAADK